MKYDTQLGEFKTKLSEAKKVLIALSPNVNNDKMAGALALYLSLKQSGKEVAVVTEAEIRVSQSVLFGVGDVRSDLPEVSSGNFILTLDGVVEDGKVPALVDLNWYPEGTALNLVFNVAPGMKFEPINIGHHYDSASFDLIITIGAANLAQLGKVYNNNLEKFTDTPKINIDNSNNNNLFGAVNIVDPGIPVSEMVMHILQGLSMPQDPDIATNIITGVFDVTRGLTSNVSADTFLTIGEAMKMGGKIVRQAGGQPQPQPQGLDIKQVNSQMNQPKKNDQRPQHQPQQRSENPKNDNRNNRNQTQPVTTPQIEPQKNDNKNEKGVGQIIQPFSEDLAPTVSPRETVTDESSQATKSDLVEVPQEITGDKTEPLQPESPTEQPAAVVLPVEEIVPTEQSDVQAVQVSQFETPTGEQVSSPSPEGDNPAPDWLTPKIFTTNGGKGLG